MASIPEEEAALAADPAAFLPFETHDEAVAALQCIGYGEASKAAEFEPADLASQLSEQLAASKLTVLDLTSTMPQTPQAAYQALAVSAFSAAAASRQDEGTVYMIMRTPANTPSLLFGHHWSNVQAFGKDCATPTCTPGVYVFHRDAQIEVPSPVFQLDCKLVARLIAARVTNDDSHFCCAICGSALSEATSAGGVRLREIGVARDNATFLKSCIIKAATEAEASGIAARTEAGDAQRGS